jgi:AmmeMemoRadiSam system protein A
MDKYINLAKTAVETFVKNNKIIKPPPDLPKNFFQDKAGAFVSLHTKDGDLRGCIGTFLPTKENLAQEIISNAITAASQDYRFSPVTKKDLVNLEYSVDILSAPVQANDLHELDPKKYGVLVKSDDGRSGLLLPDLEGVDTIELQISIACQKAGINWPEEKPSIYKFTVERHK